MLFLGTLTNGQNGGIAEGPDSSTLPNIFPGEQTWAVEDIYKQ
jgi:hypothetical protein